MTDAQIRGSFHRKRLRSHHANPDTLVLDELGLKHGKCRADIAIINGQLIGYEIKSNQDSLARLDDQIRAYSDVFDRVSAVVGTRHIDAVRSKVPDWWGIIVCHQTTRGAIHFQTIRAPRMNRKIDLFVVAQLLWKEEATKILREVGVQEKSLRQNRAVLYELLVELLRPKELRFRVRENLKNRRNWRYPTPLSSRDGSSLHTAR